MDYSINPQILRDPVKELIEKMEEQREFEQNLHRKMFEYNHVSHPPMPRDYAREHCEAQQKLDEQIRRMCGITPHLEEARQMHEHIHERSLEMFTVRHHRSQF